MESKGIASGRRRLALDAFSFSALLCGLGVHWLVARARPMGSALVSDMAGYSLRANLLRDGLPDPTLSFQSLGEPLLLVALMGQQVVDLHVALTLVHASAWWVAGYAFRDLCRHWEMSRAAERSALLVYAFWLPSALYTNLCLGESLGASLALIGAASWVGEQRFRHLLGGVSLGMACLFRPNMQLLCALLVGLDLVALGRRRSGARAHLWFALGASGAIGLGLGATRLLVPGSAGFASSGAFNAYLSVAPVRAVACLDGAWGPTLNGLLFEHIEHLPVSMTDQAFFRDKTLAFVRAHPGDSLGRWLLNLLHSSGYRVGYFPGLGGVDWLLRWFALGSFGLAGLAALTSVRRRRERVAQLTLACLVVMGVSVMFFLGTPRSRFPFDGMVLAAASASWAYLASLGSAAWARLRAREKRDPA